MKSTAVLFSALFCASSLSAQTAAAPLLWTRVDSVSSELLAWETHERVVIQPTIRRSMFVRIDPATVLRLRGQATARFTLDLFGTRATVVLDQCSPVLGHALFEGKIAGIEKTSFLTVAPPRRGQADVLAGHFAGKKLIYSLVSTGRGDIHVLREVDESLHSRLHPGCGTKAEHEVAPAPSHAVGPNASGTLVDVMVFYSTDAKLGAGGSPVMDTIIALHIARANDVNRASGVNWGFRLVYAGETKYKETGTTTDLQRFRGTNDGYMDEVHGLRKLYGGDLMALIVDHSTQWCGVGYLMTRLSTGFRSSAFSASQRGCLTNQVLTHEMGHNLGCAHDRNNSSRGVFPYSFGYRSKDNVYRTVMAYQPGNRVDLWSSPNLKFDGRTMGTSNDDNVRSNNNVGTTVSSFYADTSFHWNDLGGGIKGAVGVPSFTGSGTNNGAGAIRIKIYGTFARSGVLVVGASAVNKSVLGGMLVPSLDVPLVIQSPFYGYDIDASFLKPLPKGGDVWVQAFFLDPAAVKGVSATNGFQVHNPL